MVTSARCGSQRESWKVASSPRRPPMLATMSACHRVHGRRRRASWRAAICERNPDIRHSLIGLDERDRWRSVLAGIAQGFGHTWDSCHAFSLTTHLPTYLYLAECPEGRVVCPLIERRFRGEAAVATPSGSPGLAGPAPCAGLADRCRAFASQEVGLGRSFARIRCS